MVAQVGALWSGQRGANWLRLNYEKINPPKNYYYFFFLPNHLHLLMNLHKAAVNPELLWFCENIKIAVVIFYTFSEQSLDRPRPFLYNNTN